ncbi:two-component regulator propeller domain-containing protein [Psychroserpens sp.]|uniref:two-component regulator propeller domain-containing protein n=1 Tax=Psychroserpens sp. TaxID=2020870 RepID=UPI003859AA8A
MRLTCLFIILLFNFVRFGHCQNNNVEVEGLIFEDLQKDLIATNKYVTDLFQDSNGFIWMGSFYGVNVFDGTNFSFYKDHLDNNDGFKGYRVRKILESNNGKILVAMRNSGINVFDPATGKFKNYYDSIFKGVEYDIIQNIAESKSGELYITTGREVIVVKFDENENLVQHHIFKVKLNKKEYIRSGLFFNGNFLVETNQRILKLDETSIYTLYEGFNIRKCVVIQNELWIRADQRIGRLNINTKSTKWLNFELPREEIYITDFKFAHQNLLFIGTKKGCIRLDLNSDFDVVKATKLHINKSNAVVRIFSDNSDNLYFSVSGEGGGIKKLNINQLKNRYIGLPPLEKDYALHTF